jgi:hypothetical protein
MLIQRNIPDAKPPIPIDRQILLQCAWLINFFEALKRVFAGCVEKKRPACALREQTRCLRCLSHTAHSGEKRKPTYLAVLIFTVYKAAHSTRL